MKVSLNELRSLNDTYHWSQDPAPSGADALVEKIGAQLGAVETATPYGKQYDGIVVVKVVSCEDHPNADRLHVCKIDDGHKIENVERDEQGHVQVVCGAPNVRAGLSVAWLPPGTTVPNTYLTNPFVLESREFRGVMSHGMLASPHELGISDNHDGILEIDDTTIAPGTYFADAFHLRDDVVIDMENKMFTHRPDCFGTMGIAREIAGIQGQEFHSPDWYQSNATIETADGTLKVEVQNELPELVPRFVAVPMSGITVKPSPVWLQIALSRIGIRPINNVVDLTNYYMVLTAQPLHAYDYDKVVAQDAGADHASFVIRYPKEQEKLLLLNGKEITPRKEAIMIATRDKAIGLGGIMGGNDTEVDTNTKNIILECANFNMYSIRRTAMESGIFTDAVARFNKGQSPLQNIAVTARIVKDVQMMASGQIAGTLIDDNHLSSDVQQRGSVNPPVTVSRDFINSRLGFDLSNEAIAKLLTNVEFVVEENSDELIVKTPFWRTDIAIPEDVVEEVGRLYGFDHLPLTLPKRDLTPTPKDALLELKAEVRDVLSEAGANEILSYSFVHGNLFTQANQSASEAFQVGNALRPGLEYYRISLIPSVLEKIHPNIKAGYNEFVLFELNKVHNKTMVEDDNKLPKESERVALVVAASDKQGQAKAGAPYYEAKKYLEFLADHFAISLEFKPLPQETDEATAKPFDAARSAIVAVKGTDKLLGIVGEYRVSVLKSFKLPKYTSGFELDLDQLLAVRKHARPYKAQPRFPKLEQDICLRVSASLSYQELAQFVDNQLREHRLEQTAYSVSPLDIYQAPEDKDNKQITFRIAIASYEKTLTDQEVNKLLDEVAVGAKEKYGATRI